MKKIYTNNFSKINLHKTNSIKSEIVTQMIYGDSFSIIKKDNNFWKIKIEHDQYSGFIKKKKFINYIKPTHKISSLFAIIYKDSSFKKKVGKLPFGSKITIKETFSKFAKFQNYWIEKNNLKKINYKSKNIFSNINIFHNTKYKWGGKTFEGIDCSALIQVFFNFNNKYCPRDTGDQVKYFKKNIEFKKIKKNDIIYWKGHVAIALSNKKLIHAYGPLKKTVIMGIKETVKIIEKTSNLNVISVKRL